MRPLVLIGSALMVGMALGQVPMHIEDTIREHPAFDTLGVYYDRSSISVDTVVAINDTLWMAVLWVSDADSARDEQGEWYQRGGVCEYVFLMSIDPRGDQIKDYNLIRTECDVDQSSENATYYAHSLIKPGTVEVLSLRPSRWKEGESVWEELVPYQSQIFNVSVTGAITDQGAEPIMEPRIWRP
jgi:hypothetical protein